MPHPLAKQAAHRPADDLPALHQRGIDVDGSRVTAALPLPRRDRVGSFRSSGCVEHSASAGLRGGRKRCVAVGALGQRLGGLQQQPVAAVRLRKGGA